MKYSFLIILLLISGRIYPQLDIDWKEMASLDYYEYKGPTFWNYYSTLHNEYKKNIIRAKKLGCNMVRVPINFIPNDFDPQAPKYDHGWVSPNELGSGNVFKSTQYLKDINDMIRFCRENDMLVNLIVFNHGLSTKNCAGFHNNEGTIYQSYYTPKGTDPNWIDRAEMNLWFKDAAAWVDKIFTSINLNDVEVLEIRNEAYPNYNSEIQYPDYFYDILLLEMTTYIRNKYPSKNLMISLTQIDYNKYNANLQRMLKSAEKNIYKRPTEINYSSHSLNDLFYFDYISFHNYNTYSYRKAFQDFLDLGRLQNKPYKWHFGEIGFDLQHSTETDQAKNFLSNFQIIAEYIDKLSTTATPVKGIGIWSVFDYKYGFEAGQSVGVTDFSNLNYPRKRKAALIIENFFEGLVDNPDFEIDLGPFGAELNFGDSDFFNGWAPWWEGSENLSASFSIANVSGNNKARIKAKSNKKLGFSTSPGRSILVKPGSDVKLSVNAAVQGSLEIGKVVPQIRWFDQNGNSAGDTGSRNIEQSGFTFSVTAQVPQNAFSAEILLLLDNVPDGTTVDFDNVKFTPEEKPLIELVSEGAPPSRGRSQNNETKVEIGANVFKLKTGAEINSTNSINVSQTTAVRTRPDREYSAVSVLKSSNAVIELGFVETDENDFPLKEKKQVDYTVSDNNFKAVGTEPLKSNGDKWLNVKVKSKSDGTELKSLVIFEKNPEYEK